MQRGEVSLFSKRPKPICLIILDGFGIASPGKGNAIYLARTPHFDQYLASYPHTTLGASGEDVGLPPGQMGNSEVGHLNIGAGRIVYQELTRISKAISNGSFFSNPVLLEALEKAKRKNSSLHLMGLLSDGGVHSHNTHLYALLKLAAQRGFSKILIHIFLDGRDVPPQSALGYIQELEEKIREIGVGQIVTVSGRYYAMDRDRRWERTKLAYDALVYGKGEEASSATTAVEQSYALGVVDEFVKPTVIKGAGSREQGARSKEHGEGGYQGIKDEDSVIFFNFRPDRARQLTASLTKEDFQFFDRGSRAPKPFLVCMAEYDVTFKLPVAFPPQVLKNIFADILAELNLRQLHIAETEKYAHVTFFFNGGVEKPKQGEERILIPSPRVATYDLKPEMSAPEVAKMVCKKIREDNFDIIIVNFANLDMVGHTGILSAAIKAVEVVDEMVGKIVKAVKEESGEALIIADHGNSEKMIDEKTGKPRTAHTCNPVPCIYITDQRVKLRESGRLADVAPTLLAIMGISKPKEMTGESLIVREG